MGYTRKDRMMNGMWSKSSKQFADRMETRVLKLGLGLGAALLSGGGSSSRSRRSQPVSTYPSLAVSPTAPTMGMSAKSARVTCVILLILAPVFQALGFVSYLYWDFWTFFSLLIFSTLALFCVGFSFTIADDTSELGESGQRGFFIATIIVAFVTLCLSLWPIIVKDSERTDLSYILLTLEDILLIGGSFSLCYESSVQLKKSKEEQKPIQPTGQPPVSKRTSRTVRIKEMEERYDKVKTALAELEKAEEKLAGLSDDIDVLREYYESGRWQKDFEADEQGKIPKDLKRGVLSEDGLWNLLDDVDGRL